MKDIFEPPQIPPAALHVLIIGGGASGVLMAVHLLRQSARVKVTLIEGRGAMGAGIAYATTDPEHLLNTRVHNMSAFPEDPLHFHRWLIQRPEHAKESDQGFVRRSTYGAYLGAIMAQFDNDPRLTRVFNEVVKLDETELDLQVHLADGRRISGDRAILATGHVTPDQSREWPLVGAWQSLDAPPPQSRVVIVGSGLSMVDQVLTILRAGHQGPILSISRRGLLPRDHAKTTPMLIEDRDLPLGTSVSTLLQWARRLAVAAERQGGTWRDAVDGIRPHVRRIWRSLPQTERARFLRHVATWWDVHRHRIPPQSQARLNNAILTGQLTIRKAAFQTAIARPEGGYYAFVRPFRSQEVESITAGRVIDCRGIRRDPEQHASPLVADLLARGAARIDPLRIGLDVDDRGRLLRRDGSVNARVYTIGPASRAAFWEITAIPDIREQVAQLAQDLTLVASPATV